MSEGPYLSRPFDHTGLPVGLPDNVYASWLAARSELCESPSLLLGQQRFQFCYGYLQALADSQAVDERICAFLSVEIREVWVEVLNVLTARGL